jgi:hypothetical protein
VRRASVRVGNGGCLSLVLGVTLLWALLFGVTISGRWYGIACSTERGVEFTKP